MILVVGYMLAITVLTAPLAMPIRWTAGEIPIYQLVLAMALTAATAVLLVWVASSIYRRALPITGRRVRLREVIGGRTLS
jgi:ABC-2 type transport system permease protein